MRMSGNGIRRSRHAGASLLEVLVALLILGLGVVAVAALQLQALRSAHEAGLRTTALQIALELAERMRPHRSQPPRTTGADPFLGFVHDARDHPPAPARGCDTETCTPVQLAAFDLYQAALRVREDLPGGRVAVCRDSKPWDQAKQALRWHCEDSESAAPLYIKIGWQVRDGGKSTDMREMPPLVALPVDY